jgi:hypothetical protein
MLDSQQQCLCGETHDLSAIALFDYNGVADPRSVPETVVATVPAVGSWRLPALYLAAHTHEMTPGNIPILADRFGWAKVSQTGGPESSSRRGGIG